MQCAHDVGANDLTQQDHSVHARRLTTPEARNCDGELCGHRSCIKELLLRDRIHHMTGPDDRVRRLHLYLEESGADSCALAADGAIAIDPVMALSTHVQKVTVQDLGVVP